MDKNEKKTNKIVDLLFEDFKYNQNPCIDFIFSPNSTPIFLNGKIKHILI